MRKQYHSRRSGADMLIWDCDHLVALTEGLPRRTVQFDQDPEPDHVNIEASDLPYQPAA